MIKPAIRDDGRLFVFKGITTKYSNDAILFLKLN
jgi:hypothetical protein